MIISVTSSRGHHEAVVEPEVGRQVFEKLTGKRRTALPESVRTKVPDTWNELDALWRDGTDGYTAVGRKPGSTELAALGQYDPCVEEVVFLAPVTGG